MAEMIVTSSVLILFIIALRFILRWKISRRLQYALWLVVAVRLLVPISIPSPISVMNAVDAITSDRVIIENQLHAPEGTVEPSGDAVFAPAPDTPGDTSVPVSFRDIAVGIWAIGAVAVGSWFLGSNLFLRRKLTSSRTRYYRPECMLPVYISDVAFSPCLFGIIRPSIYVNSSSVEDEFSAKCVLTHELCHYRQLDHIWSAVRIICVVLYWYNPLVWIAAVLSRNDCELSCDELSVRSLGEENRLKYGKVLLSFVRAKPTVKNLALAATTMAANKKNMKERIGMIAKSPKTLVPALVALVLALILIVGCTYTGAKTPSDNPSGESPKDLTAVFPAYEIDNPNNIPFYNTINSTPKFSVTADFPEGWVLKDTNGGTSTPTGEFYTPLFIYDGEECIGYIGFNVFEPYTEEIEQTEYHKTVWPTLRLSSMFIWDPFTSVKTTENGESGVVNIMYLDPEEISNHPGALASVPELNTKGVLAYDKELKVFVGIAFVPDSVDDALVNTIAESLVITVE